MKQPLSQIDTTELNLNDKLIDINRVAKVMKGGKRLRFSALVVTGDGEGHVGLGIGKASEVPTAINKGGAKAKKNLIKVPLAGSTIPHEITIRFGAAKVLLKPAAPVTKSLGTANHINVAKATMQALSELKEPKKELARRKATVKTDSTEEAAASE